MFFRRLTTTVCGVIAVTAAGIGLTSTTILAQSNSGWCTSILERSTKLVGSFCNPNESDMFCTESPDDWRPTSDIGVATMGKTYWYLTDNSGTEGWIDSDATSGARACRRRD